VAAAKKKDLTPHEQLDKLDKHIDDTWNRWYKAGCAEKRGLKLTNFHNVVDRLRAAYDVCGEVNAPLVRRRRSEDDYNRDDDGEEEDEDEENNYDDEDEGGDDGEHHDGDDHDGDDYFDFEDGLMDPRLSKNNKDKAAKQLGKIIKNFGANHLWNCTKGVNADKAADLGKKWTGNLRRMKCAGGHGW